MIPKDKWIEIIKDFHENKPLEVIKRDLKIPLDFPIHRAISIIGPRRAGKTYRMFQAIKELIDKKIKKEQIIYINFERADLGLVNSTDLVRMLETYYEIYSFERDRKIWLFLDEIQNVSDWERFVRTTLDKGNNVFISGSSSKLLSKEIATSMRGRNLSYVILPFSFKEYLSAKKIKHEKFLSSGDKSKILNALKTYLEHGGYPETILYDEEREKMLTEIKETVIYRDIIEREKVRNVKALKLLIEALINSKEFSVNKFYNFLKSLGMKVGKNTLYNYTQILNDVFFVFLLKKFSYSYKKEEQSLPKVYFVDNGLLRVSGVTDKGRLMENLVFIELFRRGLDISYYQFVNKEEVDFVVKENKKAKQLIQVCYDVTNFNTKDRETRSLIKASKELKCNNLIVLTWDYENEEKIKGKKIKFIPLWKWLLF